MIYLKYGGFLLLFIASLALLTLTAGWLIDPLPAYCELIKSAEDGPRNGTEYYACYGGYGWIYLGCTLTNIAAWIIGAIAIQNHEENERPIRIEKINADERYQRRLLDIARGEEEEEKQIRGR